MPSNSQRSATDARAAGFTLVELLIGISLLATFSLTATYALASFNRNAAVNRNATAGTSIVQDRMDRVITVPYNLSSGTPPSLVVTADGVDLNGDGAPDGVVDETDVPIVVTRDSSQATVVRGTLYRRVTAVGMSYGLTTDTDLLQVQYLLQYRYRGRDAYARLVSLKARD